MTPLIEMPLPRVVVFTSPKAGSGAAREQIPRLESLLRSASISSVKLSDPERIRPLCDQARTNGDPQPIFVAAGGDGTLSLIAANCDPDTPLVPMPMGTENLLARHFRQTNQADDVFRTIRSGKMHQIDAGEANGRLFLIMVTAGFDADVVRRVHLRRKGHISRWSYLRPIFQSLRSYRFPEIRVSRLESSGELTENVIDSHSAGWAMAFNFPCYGGGLNIEPDAVGDDGALDLITFKGQSILSGLSYVLRIPFKRHLRHRHVRREKAVEVRFESSERVAYELDGDYVGRLPLQIRTLPGRVRLLVPPRFQPS